MAVERQRGFEAKRVACPEARGRDVGGDQTSKDSFGHFVRRRDLEPRLAGVARAGDSYLNALVVKALHTKPSHRRETRVNGVDLLSSARTLHGEDAALGGDVTPGQRRGDARGVRRIGHDVEFVLTHPPHNDVVHDETVVGQQMGVLRATWGNFR